MSGDDLSFERAEFEPADHCAACRGDLGDAHFRANGVALCGRCAHEIEHGAGTRTSRVLRAALFGGLAAIVSAAVWWGIRTVTGYEIGLIAIGVGFLVGFGVRVGSTGRGGALYQALAIFLAYAAIATSYVPDIATMITAPDPAQQEADAGAGPDEPIPYAMALAIAFPFAFFVPFLAFTENVGSGIMGLLIIAIALYEAWKLNKANPIVVEGPFPRERAWASEAPP